MHSEYKSYGVKIYVAQFLQGHVNECETVNVPKDTNIFKCWYSWLWIQYMNLINISPYCRESASSIPTQLLL